MENDPRDLPPWDHTLRPLGYGLLAAALIVAHNHPSGDAEPSIDDQSLTRRLVTAGALLGITVLDHIIVGGRSHVSLAERGLI